MVHALLQFAVLVATFAAMGLIPGIRIRSFGTAVVSALVFSVVSWLLSWLIWRLLVVGTLGLAFIALGFLTNLVLLWATDKIIDDFEIKGLGPLALGALLLTAATSLGRLLW